MAYYTAAICNRGHWLTTMAERFPDSVAPFCPECGAPVQTACPSCGDSYKGSLEGGEPSFYYDPPAYCRQCGQPHPWTAEKLTVARESIALLAGLSVGEQEALGKHLGDLGQDTAAAELTAMKVKLILNRARGEAVPIVRRAVGDLASTAAKKILFPDG